MIDCWHLMPLAFQSPSCTSADGALLWRFPPRREAEVIRDGILQASGKLDSKIGGVVTGFIM